MIQRDMSTCEENSELLRGGLLLAGLLVIPLAGIFGPPLLILLLLLFLGNPAHLGERCAQWAFFKYIPGFRSGQRGRMALASLLYLLPISLLGIIVVGVDGFILGLLP